MDKLNLPPFEATLNAAGKTSGNAPSTVGNGHYRKEKLGNLLPRPRFLLQITGSSLPCGAFLPANTLPTLPIARFPVRAGHLALRAGQLSLRARVFAARTAFFHFVRVIAGGKQATDAAQKQTRHAGGAEIVSGS